MNQSRFGHREHLETAWGFLTRDGIERGAENTIEFIKQAALAHGEPERYNETMTRFWIAAVAGASELTRAKTFDELLERHPQLADKALPFRHWRREVLLGAEAKAVWIEPDLLALPGPVRAGRL